MALTGTYSKKVDLFEGEVTREDCYIRIRNMVVNKIASANIDILSGRDGFIIDQIEIRNIPIDLKAENYHSQVYNHIKNMECFKYCEDY